MYARTVQRPKQRTAELKRFAAPVAGWISSRNLAKPAELANEQGAAILDNFFPTATSAVLRRGKNLYATLGQGDAADAVTALFSYNLGGNRSLFASTATTIYDITNVIFPENSTIGTDIPDEEIGTDTGDILGWFSTIGMEEWTGALGGDWITAQFTTTGATYLIGVNGASEGFIYDGTQFFPYIVGGITAVGYDTVITPFTAGTVVTGGTSAATGTIFRVTPTTLYLRNVTGTFQNNETLIGGGGSALVNGAPSVAVPGITFPGSLTTANMSYVWIYKNRLWFIEKDTFNTYYMPIDAVGGTATLFNVGPEFGRGGALLFGERWSMDSGADGGLSEQIVFVSTIGEIVVYQGLSPADVDGWRKVGLYRVGIPLGKRAWIRAGADITIATSIGFIPISQAIQRDVAALAPAAVSFPIEDAWNDAVTSRGLENWVCEIWPENQMVVVSPPVASGSNDPVVFPANARTGAWCRYTNWNARAMEVFEGRLYFGGPNGQVFLANSTGYDDGETYTGVYLPLFEDLGSPTNAKIAGEGRAVVRGKARAPGKLTAQWDFDMAVGSAPSAVQITSSSQWGTGVWGTSVWGDEGPTVLTQEAVGLGGIGYAGSMGYQVSSGAISPLDIEIIRLEMSFTIAVGVF